MLETKIVQKFGNSGHVILPKEYVGRRIKFITETKSFSQIKSEIMDILEPYLEHVLSVYLYGSYARNEQTLESDIDILVITDMKIKIEHEDYEIISVTKKGVEDTLKYDAVLILPIIKEAKPIINPQWIEPYKKYKFTKKNTKEFIEACERIVKINKEGFRLDVFDIGTLVYSLILRIRGLLMIDLEIRNEKYSKSELFNYLENKFSRKKILELYDIYSKTRENNNYKTDDRAINKIEIKKLIELNEEILNKIKRHKWEKRNTKKE